MKQQCFDVMATALDWKKILPRTLIATEEKSVPDFKTAKDRLPLLLRSNAAGDFKLRPVLIYHFQTLRALKNYAKSILPVLYKWNRKAWMTAHFFITWFTEPMKPTDET